MDPSSDRKEDPALADLHDGSATHEHHSGASLSTETPSGAGVEEDTAPQRGSVEGGAGMVPDGDAPAFPEPLHWRPVIIWKAVVFGALADVGFEVVMQQLGFTVLTWGGVLYNVVEGAALGVLAPNVGSLLGSWWTNRQIRNLQREVAT